MTNELTLIMIDHADDWWDNLSTTDKIEVYCKEKHIQIE